MPEKSAIFRLRDANLRLPTCLFWGYESKFGFGFNFSLFWESAQEKKGRKKNENMRRRKIKRENQEDRQKENKRRESREKERDKKL